MTNRRIRITTIVGAGLIIFFLFPPLVCVLVPQIPTCISEFFLSFVNIYYWLIPLIMIIFWSPAVMYYSRSSDIHFSFELQQGGTSPKGTIYDLAVTVVNKGDTAFTFNRVQFFIKGRNSIFPKDGKLQLWVYKPGEEYQLNHYSGCVVERGIPVRLHIHQKKLLTDLERCQKEAPTSSIHLRIYFSGINDMKAESKQALLEDDIKSICEPIPNTP